jgi:hypothetical protein
VKSLIGGILPPAIVVTASPINIVAAILLLFSKRPIANSTSFSRDSWSVSPPS